MRNSKTQILATILLIVLICFLALAQNTDDVIINKLLTSLSLISGLLIFKLLNNNTLKQKNEQF